MQYTITDITQKFDKVSRLKIKNNDNTIIMDVHNYFLNFFDTPIGSSFTLEYSNEIPADLTDVSYIMTAYPIQNDILSGSGLLLQDISASFKDKTYVIVRL